MSKKMTPYSEEEYFNKLDNMIHNSCAILRIHFKSRWQQAMSVEWTNDKKHRDTLLKTLDNSVKIELQRSGSVKRIKDGCLEDWDMTILSMIITNFGDAAIYSEQNKAIKSLKKLRNSIAHHTKKKITLSEYDDTVESFRKCLRSLNVDNEEIEKIIARADVTSSIIAMEKLQILYDKADDYLTAGKYQEAIDCYDEAISMPCLLPTQIGTTFEKQAKTRIQNWLNNKATVEQALLDISQALELNESSWNAYFLAGQCHRKLGDFETAILNLQRALSISPIQKDVRDELNACMLLNGIKSRGDHLTPNLRPLNFQERLDHLQNETGLHMTEEKFIKINTFAGEIIKGQDHVFKGHQYKCGWGVEQDDIEACRYYLQAAKSGNAEGIYNLGLCYQYGSGIAQNIDKALEYFFQAADLSPDLKGEQTQRQRNVGVAAAQNMLGLSYAYGIGVVQDFREAAKWYKKAMDNGLGNSANNLGILYSQGLGVPHNRKMAFMCWKEGLNLMDANAPLSLICYYFQEMEPENVLATIRTCKEMGISHYRHVSDEEFQLLISVLQLKRHEHESDVLAFEKENNMKTKGLTFRERLDRMHAEINGLVPNIQRNNETKHKNSCDIFNGTLLSDSNVLQLIKIKAEEGSLTATKVHLLLQHCSNLTKLLQSEHPFYREVDTESIVELIYNCATLPFDELVLQHEDLLKVKSIIKHLFDQKCGDRGEDDKRIVLCDFQFEETNLH